MFPIRCATSWVFTLLLATGTMAAPLKPREVIPLWPAGAPGSATVSLKETIVERSTVPFWPDRAITGITRPDLTALLPAKPNGAAVVIAPGGGYVRVVLDKEGVELAQWLNSLGVTVFLLKYRLPGEGHENAADVPLQDAQRAMRLVRFHAREWGLDDKRIGFLGASAGGHVAASIGVGHSRQVYEARDAADAVSARPDFLILLYPVVSMRSDLAHPGSRDNLLGKSPSAARIDAYSPDLHVTASTPPAFIMATRDDRAVPVENALRLHAAFERAKVPSELVLYDQGGHGFGIRDTWNLPVAEWPARAAAWLARRGVVPAVP